MTCQRVSASADCALGINVDDDISFSLPETRSRSVRGCPARTALGRAGPGNGKPKSYRPFWALSSRARRHQLSRQRAQPLPAAPLPEADKQSGEQLRLTDL